MKKNRKCSLSRSVFLGGMVISEFTALAICLLTMPTVQGSQPQAFPEPKIPFVPPSYICYRAPQPLTFDGKLDEPAWRKAAWTGFFVDIEGSLKPKPRFEKRAKMLWGDEYFYI